MEITEKQIRDAVKNSMKRILNESMNNNRQPAYIDGKEITTDWIYDLLDVPYRMPKYTNQHPIIIGTYGNGLAVVEWKMGGNAIKVSFLSDYTGAFDNEPMDSMMRNMDKTINRGTDKFGIYCTIDDIDANSFIVSFWRK